MNYLQTPDYITLQHGILMVRDDGSDSYKDLMHVKDVKINITADELEHENVRRGLKVVDKTITTKMVAKGSFMCDVPNTENLNIFLLGDGVKEDEQTSGTWSAQAFTVVKPDEWQFLGKRNLTVTAITDDAGTPVPLVEGVDYKIDLKRGMFLPLSTSLLVGTALDVFEITGTYAEKTNFLVYAGKNAIQKHIWFMGDPATGRTIDIKGYANLKPNGDLPLSADEWIGFTFDMSFNGHSEYPESPCGLYVYDITA